LTISLLYVALHGDYKYSILKNTDKELDSQDGVFSDVFTKYMLDKSLIVIGYSGRDKSIMDILEKTFSEKGTGRIYWCGYGSEIPKKVDNLLSKIKKSGRNAFYVSTGGFDKIFCDWSKLVVEGDIEKTSLYNNIIKSIKPQTITNPFKIDNYICNKHIKSNFHPITFPKDVFIFKIADSIKTFKALKELTASTNIIAVPFNDNIYAVSTLPEITSIFKDVVQGTISRVPISVKDIERNPMLISLMKTAILRMISQKRNLATDDKSKIWKRNTRSVIYNSKTFLVHDGLKIKLQFYGSDKYALLSLKPFVKIENDTAITKTDIISINKCVFDRLFNNKYDELLQSWNMILFQEDRFFSDNYPLMSDSGFKFTISSNVAYAGIKVINKTNYTYYPGKDIPEDHVIFKGFCLPEPELQFSVKESKPEYSQDIHPMRGLLNYKPYDFIQSNFFSGKDILMSIICPRKYDLQFFDFLNGINKSWNATVNSDYLVDYPGFERIYDTRINIPSINSEFWEDIGESYSKDSVIKSAYDLARNITLKISYLANKFSKSVILIFIPDLWNLYKHIEVNNEIFDLHDYVKAFTVQNGITTQFIEESTLTDPLKCQIYWWLSLSFYVKSLKTPWIIADSDRRTAFAGIGYSIKRKSESTKIVMGCSHIYSSDGQGLKYRLSNIKDYVLDNKDNPYLKYNEAYKLGISICELFLSTLQEFPKRVVIHKRTDFSKEETEGIIDSLSQAGITDVDLVSINFDTDAKFFALKIKEGQTITDTFPIDRGTCIILNDRHAYLWTHGIVPSVRKASYRYYQGGHSIPAPLVLTRYYGNTSINILANEILGLTKMNWNSFNLYTKLPATIDSSNQIARIGNLLTTYDGRTYDYRYFI
jgi:hypothetical protein